MFLVFLNNQGTLIKVKSFNSEAHAVALADSALNLICRDREGLPPEGFKTATSDECFFLMEGDSIIVDNARLAEYKERLVRNKRDKLIGSTDFYALSDLTMSTEMEAYRQALRDVTTQSGFPSDVTWPTAP